VAGDRIPLGLKATATPGPARHPGVEIARRQLPLLPLRTGGAGGGGQSPFAIAFCAASACFLLSGGRPGGAGGVPQSLVIFCISELDGGCGGWAVPPGLGTSMPWSFRQLANWSSFARDCFISAALGAFALVSPYAKGGGAGALAVACPCAVESPPPEAAQAGIAITAAVIAAVAAAV
jgi:hypothetical protein